jgi:hypothetical protein
MHLGVCAPHSLDDSRDSFILRIFKKNCDLLKGTPEDECLEALVFYSRAGSAAAQLRLVERELLSEGRKHS